MRHLASALVFATCLGWIAASIVLTGHAASELTSWDWLATVGAVFSFFAAAGSD